ncbi:MAG: hypothetical protein KAG64_01660 [Bacteroidales bacterium]|nr:hypothetical protein [Bacteroidales bacterium]
MKLFKKIALILIILSFTSISKTISADGLTIGYKYPGYIIKNKGDTLYGYIRYSNVVNNQKKCEFFINETDKKPAKVYSPKELTAYLVSDVLYRTINYSGGLFSKPLRFLKVVKDGELTLFIFYEEASVPNNEERAQTMVYYKWRDSKYPKPLTNEKFGFNFSKKMSAYVADYKELSQKILKKEKGYGLVHLYDIIDEYNAWYIINNQ